MLLRFQIAKLDYLINKIEKNKQYSLELGNEHRNFFVDYMLMKSDHSIGEDAKIQWQSSKFNNRRHFASFGNLCSNFRKDIWEINQQMTSI